MDSVAKSRVFERRPMRAMFAVDAEARSTALYDVRVIWLVF